MKVVIREKEYEYYSDYPDEWKFAGGDFFKFPVTIGHHKCFVKRFEDGIPGEQLLKKIKGMNNSNLPRFHDLVDVIESNKLVQYIFFEFSEGKTLVEVNSKNTKIDLKRLNSDLFSALGSIKSNDHWFPDFCEKNILRDKSGKFILIDLDSTLPVSTLPDRDTRCSKDYWSLVFDFCRKILSASDFGPSDFNGISFNYLHVIFLILRLKKYYAEADGEYADLHESLPQTLDLIDEKFKEIFGKALKNPGNSFTVDDIKEISQLIETRIINDDIPVPREKFILDFSISNYALKEDKYYIVHSRTPFILNWDVQPKCKLDLYRNGVFEKELDSGKNHLEIISTYDGKEKIIVYYLEATFDSKQEKSLPVTVKVTFEDIAPEPPAPLQPIIHEFKTNKTTVSHQETFSLSWSVENADQIILFRNENPYKKLKPQEKNIQLFESSAKTEKEVEFKLVAAMDSGEQSSATTTIVVAAIAPAGPPPKIHSFTSNKQAVTEDEVFLLEWNIVNATRLKLYRNDVEYKKVRSQDKSIQLFERYNEAERDIEFELVAANDAGDQEFATLRIVVNPTVPPEQLPLIHEFTSNMYNVRPQKPFTLQWIVKDANKIILYRNGTEYKKIQPQQRSIQLLEPYNKSENEIEFKLFAANDAEWQTASLIIKVVDEPVAPVPPPPNDFKKILLYVLLGLALLAIIFFFARRLPAKADKPGQQIQSDSAATIIDTAQPDSLPEDTAVAVNNLTNASLRVGETLAISGKNFPSTPGSVFIYFNQAPGYVMAVKPDRILVRVPPLTSTNSLVDVVAYINQIKFPIAKKLLLRNPVDKPKGPAIAPVATTINLTQPNETVDFKFRPEGQKIYVYATNLSNDILKEVEVTIICYAVDGSGDTEIKRESIRFGTLQKHALGKLSASNDFYSVYDKDRNKKRIRLRLSYK
ncbi:MAG: hypothetical protein ABIQ31_03005 [Ferruginibacter sp.]